MSELFSAPLDAAVNAEAAYRRIWTKWLQDQLPLVTVPVDPNNPTGARKFRDGFNVEKWLNSAPAVNIDGVINLAITMRIAGVREISGGVGAGLTLGPIYGSGSFGFVNRTSEESVFQANARFTLTNMNKDLSGLLEQCKLDPPKADSNDVNNAIALLKNSLLAESEDEKDKALAAAAAKASKAAAAATAKASKAAAAET